MVALAGALALIAAALLVLGLVTDVGLVRDRRPSIASSVLAARLLVDRAVGTAVPQASAERLTRTA